MTKLNMGLEFDVIIIGAGIGGLLLARNLTTKNILLVDKAKTVGGRVATRRVGGYSINQGLSSFVVRHPKLNELVEFGIEQKILQENDQIVSGIGGINQWPKLLSNGLKIQNSTQVARLAKNAQFWEVYDEQNNCIGKSRQIVITTPAKQAFDLLKISGIEADFLLEVNYSTIIKHFILLARKVSHSSLELIEEISPKEFLYSFTLKDSYPTYFSLFDKSELNQAILDLLNFNPEIILDSYTHRWLYAEVNRPISSDFQLELKSEGIFLMGDYFSLDGINGVASSADKIINLINSQEIAE